MSYLCAYIDPGTGSMLFAILIGIIGALNYLLRAWIVKLRFVMSGGRKVEAGEEKIPVVIFSDDKRYWSVFEPLCRELDKRGREVVYLTASDNDPALKNEYEHVRAEFAGEGNKAFARLNFMKASILISTTPGLDVYQWKRSKDIDYYVHILHAASDVHLYRMFGLDYYDAVLISGDYQEKQIRAMEEQRNLPAKEVVKVGIPYMDEMRKRLEESGPVKEHERTVLLAPSWGKNGILSKYGSSFIDLLIATGYHIIVRPHPQSFTSEKDMMDGLMAKYPEGENFEWNRDPDNFEVLKRSDILISDFSGVIFDFTLVFDKPVIYTPTSFDTSPYDAWWLPDIPIWTFEVLPELGSQLTEEKMSEIKSMIDECLDDTRCAEGRKKARSETWCYMGEGAVRMADYIENKYMELTRKKEA